MPKARPKTGERRKTRQPLNIDKLPPLVHDILLKLRNQQGKTLKEISALSAEPFGRGKLGFIDWANLEPRVRKLFPEKRIPETTLHRWFDLRYEQVYADVMVRSEQARAIAESFAKSMLVNGNEAVVNAARDTIMNVLAEDSSDNGRTKAAAGLIALAEVMQKARANDIKERKVSVDERRIAQLEKDAELKRKRFQREMDAAEKKLTKGQALTADDINQIRQRVFGIGPAPVAAA